MTNLAFGLLHGMVIETDVTSYTGSFLYSDYATGRAEKDSALNKAAKIPFVGIVAGVARVALGVFHSLGHLIAAAITRKKGHLYHAAKGGCEVLRGVIEAIPLIGRVFANLYNSTPNYECEDVFDSHGGRSWWMIKIFNPEKPDGLDEWMGYWSFFPQQYYVKG